MQLVVMWLKWRFVTIFATFLAGCLVREARREGGATVI